MSRKTSFVYFRAGWVEVQIQSMAGRSHSLKTKTFSYFSDGLLLERINQIRHTWITSIYQLMQLEEGFVLIYCLRWIYFEKQSAFWDKSDFFFLSKSKIGSREEPAPFHLIPNLPSIKILRKVFREKRNIFLASKNFALIVCALQHMWLLKFKPNLNQIKLKMQFLSHTRHKCSLVTCS